MATMTKSGGFCSRMARRPFARGLFLVATSTHFFDRPR
jgi:hypothetical protein